MARYNTHDDCWHSIFIYWRVATGDSDDDFVHGNNWSELVATDIKYATIIREYSGVSITNPIAGINTTYDIDGGWNNSTGYNDIDGGFSNPITIPSLAPQTAAGMQIIAHLCQDYPDVTIAELATPAGFGNRDDATQEISNYPYLAVADKAYTSAAAAGATWTMTGPDAASDGRNTALQVFLSESDAGQYYGCISEVDEIVENSGTTLHTGKTITVDADAGELLLASLIVDNSALDGATATGWIEIYNPQPTVGDYWCQLFYRVATGTTADNFAPSWTNDGYIAAEVYRVHGADTSGTFAFLDTAENTTNMDSTTALSNTCGTVNDGGSPGLAIAFTMMDNRADWNNSRLMYCSAGWQLCSATNTDNASNPNCLIAVKNTWGDSADHTCTMYADPAENDGGGVYSATVIVPMLATVVSGPLNNDRISAMHFQRHYEPVAIGAQV